VSAYYNEIDEYAAQWLRNLIAAGHIAPGDVDTRSIEDVHPDDLLPYTQCHFFAGVGVWSYALRRSGWPDDRRVWTGSCPCQPFSAAGQGGGFDDERHLWPAWQWLIMQCRPATVLGEQVASKDADPWIDLVHADLEAMGYAFGAVPFPSAGVGAPHIRDRLYWMADASGARLERRDLGALGQQRATSERGRAVGDMGDSSGSGSSQQWWGRIESERPTTSGESSRLADSHGGDAGSEWQQRQQPAHGVAERMADDDDAGQRAEPGLRLQGSDFHDADGRGPLGGFWSDAEWIACRDNKWRPVEPGTFPLAHGAPSRVGRLRAYGNAINAEAARVFIESMM
jgi:DNA (cytosine-5)-methyltransferase 1